TYALREPWNDACRARRDSRTKSSRHRGCSACATHSRSERRLTLRPIRGTRAPRDLLLVLQRLIQIAQEIFFVLDTDRQADRSIGDPGPTALFFVQIARAHEAAGLHERFGRTQARRNRE